MSEQELNSNQPEQNAAQDQEETELGFTDKIVGIFSEPSKTYSKVAAFPLKYSDWIVPYLLFFILLAVSNLVIMSNPDIKYQVKQKQKEVFEKRLADEVNAKKITPDAANQQREQMEKQMAMMDSPFVAAITFVSTLIFGFIVIFIVVGYFYLFARFVFKDEISYTAALIANGLTSYIGIISIIVATGLSLVFGRAVKDISVASLMNIEGGTVVYYLLSKIDVITIWSYFVFSLGLIKLSKTDKPAKYYGLVFGSWIGWSLLFFILSQFIPFFKSFTGN